ncbi:MAG: HalX domain-containing protein [Polyangiaceae bacterium]|nr:HalX domain-containing protein [Polyangiaceae bacterium]
MNLGRRPIHATVTVVNVDRVERLMEQVLSEVQDFRLTTSDQFHRLEMRIDRLDAKIDRVHEELSARIDRVHEELSARIDRVAQDVKLTQRAVLEVSDEVKRLDNHEVRLVALEGAAQ